MRLVGGHIQGQRYLLSTWTENKVEITLFAVPNLNPVPQPNPNANVANHRSRIQYLNV